MRQATAELNEEYYARIGQIEQANPHDVLEIEASDGVSAIRWEDVLSVYAVKVTTDGVNGMDVVTMDEQKKEILRGVMWDMNQITYRSVTVKKEVEVVAEDEDGNEVDRDAGDRRNDVDNLSAPHDAGADGRGLWLYRTAERASGAAAA